jgi:DNA-binding NarL/FixJ family response regulator
MPVDAPGFGVLIAEDNRDLREALRVIIDEEPGMYVAGTVSRVPELLCVMRTSTARALVLDLDLGGESSVPALQTLREQHPQLAVVIFSGSDRDALAHFMDRIGRCEFVTKSGDVMPLLDAIRRSVHGRADPASSADRVA